MIEARTLQRYSLFGGLLAEQIDLIRPFMERESFQAGDDIIVEGTPNDRIRFILDGRVEVLKEKIKLYEFGEGDVFGEMEVLDVMPSAATIRVLSPASVMSISNRALREIYRADIKVFAILIMNLARDISRRLRKMDEKAAPSKAV
ncbi:MAG: cyclic nucleotide-binding domain-containing protein [Spirochaetaceae bacterium]|nr:cyclic nucleotide-binding domain-containing protein [Spirochaetaceae bacterium]